MNQRQIELVQQSYARASRMGAHLAATFYGDLFAIEPALRPLFKGDMIVQGQKLMIMLGHVVNGLTEPETILPAVRELAVRHLQYGVEERHYALVGTALLRSLRHELGFDFTPEMRAAWAAAYKLLSDAMREAAYGVTAERQL